MAVGFAPSGASEKAFIYTNEQGNEVEIVIAHISDYNKEGNDTLMISAGRKDHVIKFQGPAPRNTAYALVFNQF